MNVRAQPRPMPRTRDRQDAQASAQGAPERVPGEFDGDVDALTVHRRVALSAKALDNLRRRKRSGAAFGAAVRVEDDRRRVLLVRLHRETGWTDEWMTPGGGSEPGETPYDTARREVREETAVRVRGLRLWKVLRNTYFDRQGREARFNFYQFTARYRAGPVRTLVPEEIAEVRWFHRLPQAMAFREDWLRPPQVRERRGARRFNRRGGGSGPYRGRPPARASGSTVRPTRKGPLRKGERGPPGRS